MRSLHMYHLAATMQRDRHRGEDPYSAARQLDSDEARQGRVSLGTRIRTAIQDVLRHDDSLTDRPCRLPDGRVGRVAVVEAEGEWMLVCRVA